MKSKKTTAICVSRKTFLPPLFGLFVLGRAAEAQQSIVQSPIPPVESVSQLNLTNSFEVFAPQPNATPPTSYEPFRWDQFVVRPHMDYQFIDAAGILAATNKPVNTTIQQISPGILINLGPHWSLDYTATIGLYSNPNFGTEFDHSVTLTGQTVYGSWTYGFLQTALISSSPLIEFGGQTDQEYFTTAVTGHHEDSQYISEDLGFYQNIQIFPGSGYENMRSWSTLDWLNYQPTSRFNIGIGPGLGYDNADFGPDSVFEQAQARLNWRASRALSFQLAGGIIETEFLGSQGADDLFSPVYSGTIQFKPFAETEFSVYASRTVSPSAFVGEYSENSSVGCSLSQRFFGQIYFSLYGMYSDQEYVSSSVTADANRTDHYYSLSPRLSHSFLKRGNISIFYQYNSDRSTVAGYSFSSNQFGAELSYNF